MLLEGRTALLPLRQHAQVQLRGWDRRLGLRVVRHGAVKGAPVLRWVLPIAGEPELLGWGTEGTGRGRAGLCHGRWLHPEARKSWGAP